MILFSYHQSQATHSSQHCDVLPTITYVYILHFLLSQIVNGSHPLTHFIFIVMACRITTRDFCVDPDDINREKYWNCATVGEVVQREHWNWYTEGRKWLNWECHDKYVNRCMRIRKRSLPEYSVFLVEYLHSPYHKERDRKWQSPWCNTHSLPRLFYLRNSIWLHHKSVQVTSFMNKRNACPCLPRFRETNIYSRAVCVCVCVCGSFSTEYQARSETTVESMDTYSLTPLSKVRFFRLRFSWKQTESFVTILCNERYPSLTKNVENTENFIYDLKQNTPCTISIFSKLCSSTALRADFLYHIVSTSLDRRRKYEKILIYSLT